MNTTNTLTDNTKQDKIRRALELLADGYTKWKAAKEAGIANPSRDFFPVLQRTEAQEFVIERIQNRIKLEIAPEATRRAIAMMRDPNTSQRIKWEICKRFMEAGAGIVTPPADKDDGKEKTAETMTAGELKGFIAAAQNELARRAKPVEEGAQVIDNNAE